MSDNRKPKRKKKKTPTEKIRTFYVLRGSEWDVTILAHRPHKVDIADRDGVSGKVYFAYGIDRRGRHMHPLWDFCIKEVRRYMPAAAKLKVGEYRKMMVLPL